MISIEGSPTAPSALLTHLGEEVFAAVEEFRQRVLRVRPAGGLLTLQALDLRILEGVAPHLPLEPPLEGHVVASGGHAAKQAVVVARPLALPLHLRRRMK